jgi:hypothetical protein
MASIAVASRTVTLALGVFSFVIFASPSRRSGTGPGFPDRPRVPAVQNIEVEVEQDEVLVQECEVMLTFDAVDGKKFFTSRGR